MTLFWKLFVSFGIAMALTLVGAVLISFRLTTLAFDQFNIENREGTIEMAASELIEGGRDGLARWLARAPAPAPGIEVMVLDATGTELLGRTLPSYLARFLDAGSRRRGRGGGPSNVRPPRLTATIEAPDGEEYRLLFVRTQISVLGILTWPATQLAVLLLAVGAAAITSLLLARYLARPIVRLQRATRALAAGSLDARVGMPFSGRRDEVGTLARDFDAMAGQIQALVTDKETLLRDVSHELRSPLARIRVAVALAQRKANEAAQSDLARIELDTERLDDLVGQILTLARLRSEGVASTDSIDLAELINEVVADVEFETPTTKIVVKTPPVPLVKGVRSELKSAIENVLRNAVIHSLDNDGIAVRLSATSDGVEISVSDHGPGIDSADLPRIFEPFYRADASRDHARAGFGLGLAIAASVVERHGGSVEATNRTTGGLQIRFKLPIEPGDGRSATPVPGPPAA